MGDTIKLYTVGYIAGWTPAALLEKAKDLGAIVYDSRIRPYSRQPEWNQKALQSLLGSRYVHADGLGNVNYKGGPIKLQNPAPWIERIATSIHPVILLCACGNPSVCHRTVIADMLKQQHGMEYRHLFPERKRVSGGGAPPSQLKLF